MNRDVVMIRPCYDIDWVTSRDPPDLELFLPAMLDTIVAVVLSTTVRKSSKSCGTHEVARSIS